MGVGEDGERARVNAFRNPEFFHRSQDVPRAEDVDAFALLAVLRPSPPCGPYGRRVFDHRGRTRLVDRKNDVTLVRGCTGREPNKPPTVNLHRSRGFVRRRRRSMAKPLTHKLIRSHLAEGKMDRGEEVPLKVDQALLQDATGTLAWLEFEQMQRPSVKVRQATQYIDHN